LVLVIWLERCRNLEFAIIITVREDLCSPFNNFAYIIELLNNTFVHCAIGAIVQLANNQLKRPHNISAEEE